MPKLPEPQFITNAAGQRVAVIIDMAEWEKLLAEIEEMSDLRAFDEAMAGDLDALHLEEARAEVEKERANR